MRILLAVAGWVASILAMLAGLGLVLAGVLSPPFLIAALACVLFAIVANPLVRRRIGFLSSGARVSAALVGAVILGIAGLGFGFQDVEKRADEVETKKEVPERLVQAELAPLTVPHRDEEGCEKAGGGMVVPATCGPQRVVKEQQRRSNQEHTSSDVSSDDMALIKPDYIAQFSKGGNLHKDIDCWAVAMAMVKGTAAGKDSVLAGTSKVLAEYAGNEFTKIVSNKKKLSERQAEFVYAVGYDKALKDASVMIIQRMDQNPMEVMYDYRTGKCDERLSRMGVPIG